MRILVTNDDGIAAPGLWAIAAEASRTHEVFVVAPDREQSAIGTAVTLRQPLRVRQTEPQKPGIVAYSVEGSPSDSVILSLEKLVKERVDLVISGINQGANLGDDVLISGTVGAALQGYLRNLPSIAISIATIENRHLDIAARLAALLATKIDNRVLPRDIFLNVNLPDLPLSEIKGIRITQLAHKTHIDSVNEGHDGRREYYWLVRRRLSQEVDPRTDIWAIENGYISINALHASLFGKPPLERPEKLCAELMKELTQWQMAI